MDNRLTIHYLALRRLIGIFALSHPIVLYVGGKLLFSLDMQDSMSHYYHTGMRDVFVGLDVTTGVFLLCYRGYSRQDQIAALLAGACAIIVALFPTAAAGDTSVLATIFSITHSLAAVVFLLALAYFCLILFVKSAPGEVITVEKRLRNIFYRICGFVILSVIAIFAAYAFMPWMQSTFKETPFVFWMEFIAFWAFGLSWLVKGNVLRQR